MTWWNHNVVCVVAIQTCRGGCQYTNQMAILCFVSNVGALLIWRITCCCLLHLQRDLPYLKQEFVKVYMSSVYFLLHSPSLPCHRWADPASEEQRARIIYTILDVLKHLQHTSGQMGGPEVFLDPKHQHLAFDITELTFDLLHVAR